MLGAKGVFSLVDGNRSLGAAKTWEHVQTVNVVERELELRAAERLRIGGV